MWEGNSSLLASSGFHWPFEISEPIETEHVGLRSPFCTPVPVFPFHPGLRSGIGFGAVARPPN